MTAPRSLRELFEQLGLREVPADDGTFVMEMPVDERTTNTAGGLQGGLIATMADVAWILIQRQLVHECKIRWLTDLLQPKASSDRLAA